MLLNDGQAELNGMHSTALYAKVVLQKGTTMAGGPNGNVFLESLALLCHPNHKQSKIYQSKSC